MIAPAAAPTAAPPAAPQAVLLPGVVQADKNNAQTVHNKTTFFMLLFSPFLKIRSYAYIVLFSGQKQKRKIKSLRFRRRLF
jgi:hypothetical protein